MAPLCQNWRMSEQSSDLSKRVANELWAAQRRGGWTWKYIEEKTGIASRTMKRMLAGEVEIPISRLLLICAAAGLDAAEIVEEATRHMPKGYVESLLVGDDVSAPADNVTALHPRDMNPDQLEKMRHAATYDEEAETPEPEGP